MLDTLEKLYGRVVSMSRATDGSTLLADAAIADTVLSVASTDDFDDEDGGQVVINGVTYDYVDVDHDAVTITLDTGLLAAAAEDDLIELYDPEVQGVVVEYVAQVMLDDQDPGDEPIEVTVQHGLVNYLAEVVRGRAAEAVTLIRDGDDDFIIWQIDGKLAVDVVIEELRGGYEGTIQDVLDATVEAFNFAASLNKVYRQNTPPTNPDGTGRALVANDPWFDTDDSNKPYRWSGSAWVDATQSWLATNPSSSFPNVVISPAGLAAYNSGGTAVTTIDSSDGTITTTGSFWAGGDISGATVTGGTVQTDASVNVGIKMNSAGFAAYDSVGSPTLAISAVTGAIVMKGSLTAGSSITGAAITGSTFSTPGANPMTLDSIGIQWASGSKIVDTGNIVLDPGAFGGQVQVLGGMTLGNFLDMGGFAITGAAGISCSSLGASGGVSAGGAGHFNTLYADSAPTTGAAINARMDTDGGLYRNTSARRYKYDEQEIALGMEALRCLKLKRFRRYDDPNYDEADPTSSRWYYGVVADDAHDDETLRPWVIYEPDGVVDGWDYAGFGTAGVLVLAEELHAAQSEVAELRAETAELRAAVDALTARLDG